MLEFAIFHLFKDFFDRFAVLVIGVFPDGFNYHLILVPLYRIGVFTATFALGTPASYWIMAKTQKRK